MSCSHLKASQASWAEGRQLLLDSAGYVERTDQNLLQPLCAATERDFQRGSGGELRGSRDRRPKLQAVHSSAALACNAFDYWRTHGLGLVEAALDLPAPILEMRFEAQFPTGVDGEPPNLDLALELRNGTTWAIESKFTEPYCSAKDPRKSLKEKYFPEGTPLWSLRGLAQCGDLALQIREGGTRFHRLDVAQLLKHILGLHNCRRTYALVYLWLDQESAHGEAHRSEVERFALAVRGEVTFRPKSYQALIANLRALAGPFHDTYFRYMAQRYVGEVAR